MCFSASASFIAAGILATLGAASVAWNKKPEYRLLALTPLLFALQQAAEGVVWLTVADRANILLHKLAVYTFLGFAGIIWPIWVPLTLWLAEHDKQQKKVLACLGVGGLCVAGLTVHSFIMDPISAHVVSCSIYYDFGAASYTASKAALVAYLIPSVIPFFVSRIPYSQLFGILLTLSLMISQLFKYETAASVWCFFAALLSSLILVMVTKK